jgi:dTDP-4-dehydrorhamnose 3,5-epimerase
VNDVRVFEPRRFEDDRGWFQETYQASNLPQTFAQDSLSHSRKHVLRGLHLQHPHLQGKLVYCLVGRVLDVAVDLRADSATYGQHVAHELSADNGKQLWIPEGFAHGFVVLSDEALFAYKSTVPYDPNGQVSIRWNDPALGIDWGVTDPVLSEKDANAPLLSDLAQKNYR